MYIDKRLAYYFDNDAEYVKVVFPEENWNENYIDVFNGELWV